MKKITLIILALTVNVSFAQTILSEDFNSYDSGALIIGDGNDAIFESKANRDANPDCSSGAIPERDDLQILDNGGDKYVAFYYNGINCKGSDGSHVAFAAFMNKKLPALTIDTFYTVTFEAWFVSDVAEFSATKPTVPLVVSLGILISPFRPLNTVAPAC